MIIMKKIQSVTVRYALWSGGLIQPFFFENEADYTLIVNDLHYRNIITHFFMPHMEDIALEDM